MRLPLAASLLVLLVVAVCLPTPARLAPSPAGESNSAGRDSRGHHSELGAGEATPALMNSYHGFENESAGAGVARPDDQNGGIKEVVPKKYAERYGEWKEEFLSTELGRQQWEMFERNKSFTLTVVVASDRARGAGTGSYKWDDAGKLVAATIILGSRINEGYPNPVYYPVMNSLAPGESSAFIGGQVLAATKIAHEFGHLTRTSGTDPTLYQLQSKLMPVYNKILLSNGRNPDDPQLVELAQQMRGTPVEIWEDREYWGETNAMLYLRDRFTEDNLRCTLFHRIKRSVDLYAKGYSERFIQVAQSTPEPRRCGWR